jgi:hypothetical protein
MTLTIQLTDDEKQRLTEAASSACVPPEEVVHRLIAEHLPGPAAREDSAPEQPALHPAIAMLRKWREEDYTDDPEELRRAEEELAEFKRQMNAPRKEAGERLLFPE